MSRCTPCIFFTPLILTRKRTPKRRPFSCNQPTNGKELGGMAPLVQVGGLEPPRYKPQEPKSWVSANSTIPACWMVSPELHWCRETSYGIILLRQNLSLKEGDTLQGCETWFRYIFYRRACIWTRHWWLLRDLNPDLLDWCPSWSTFELRSHMAGILGFEPRL